MKPATPGVGNVPARGASENSEDEQRAVGEIVRHERLGGLLKRYERRAA